MNNYVSLRTALVVACLSSATGLMLASGAQAGTLVKDASGAVTDITGLDVNGTLYDVIFQRDTFNALFDGALLTGGTPTGRVPTFWQNRTSAFDAADAIIAALGTAEYVTESTNATTNAVFRVDSFIVPYQRESNTQLRSAVDTGLIPATDGSGEQAFRRFGRPIRPYALFTPTAPAIPTPAMLPGLLGMGLAAYRKRRLAQLDPA